MTDAVEFLQFVTAKYKLKLTKEDFELLYDQFKNKSQNDANTKSAVMGMCSFMVPSKKAECGLKLKKGQAYCTRHEKVLASRAEKRLAKGSTTGKASAIADDSLKEIKALFVIDSQGRVTHRKVDGKPGCTIPLNQRDIELCEEKGLKYREPELEDFLDSEEPASDIGGLEDRMNNLGLQRNACA